ncbi:Exosome complex component RRP42 [Podochytrium sp. JEL0797]|nr:Exosome complex component RRP42 [Podochytrium sp. JEL0797]
MISVCERKYIASGVAANMRCDGRARSSVRSSRTSLVLGSVSQASGSAQSATCLVGVKVAIDTQQDTFEKRIHVAVDAAPLLKVSDAEASAHAAFAAALLNAAIKKDPLHFASNQAAWRIHCDVLLLTNNGNTKDEICKTIRAALINTRIPKVEVEESGNVVEFDVADEETEVIPGAEDLPAVVTLYKIGNYHVLDPTPLEELCSDVQLTVAVSRSGLPCAIHKFGSGSLDPSLLQDMLADAKVHGLKLFEEMDKEIERETLRLQNLSE